MEYNTPYIVGQITAIVEAVVKTPKGFAGLVAVNPLQKLTPHLAAALKTERSEELEELVSSLGGSLPSPWVDPRGQYWIGYYHQKSRDDRRTLGHRLQALRQERGLSTRQLAALTGLAHSHIVRIESGRYGFSTDTLEKITTALGAEVIIK